MVSLAGFRRELDVPDSTAYLNTAATGLTPRYVRRAMAAYEEDRARRGEAGWDDWLEAVDEARALTGRFFGARPEEVAFLSNTGHGINTVATMLPWKAGDEVVTTDQEFPSNLMPWKRLAARGVKLRLVPARNGRLWADDVEGALSDRTRLLSLSWVSYRSGERYPLRRLADAVHARGGKFLVDGIQGSGALRPQFQKCGADFWANGPHKWLMAPFGVGAFLIRKDLVQEFEPPYVGWFSRKNPEDFSIDNDRLADTARRFEIGNLNFGGIAGWAAAMEGFLALDGFESAVLDRSDRVVTIAEGLGFSVVTPRERAERAGIVILAMPKAQEARDFLARRGVEVAVRGAGIRVSPHFWNSTADLGRFEDALRAWTRKRDA